MTKLKLIIGLALLAFAITTNAASTQKVARVTFTNALTFVTNGSTITINGDTRRWTNGTLNDAATWIQHTNNLGWAATNAWLHLSRYTPSGVDYSFATNGGVLYIVSTFRTNVLLSVSLSAGLGTVTYETNVWTDYTSLSAPNGALPTQQSRTNNASALIDLINDNRTTNQVANGNTGWTNIIDRTSDQVLSNKSIVGPRISRGTNDGAWMTNVVMIHGSNGVLTGVTFIGGTYSGLISALTNGQLYNTLLWSNRLSNSWAMHGTVHVLSNGLYSAPTLTGPITTNLINYGNAIRSHGSGGNSFQVGSNAQSLGARSVAVGNGAFAVGADSIAIGTGARATNNYATAIGNNAYADDLSGANVGGFAFGNDSRATNNGSMALGPGAHADGAGSLAVGNGAEALGDNSAAIYGWAGAFQALTFGGSSYEANTLSLGYGAEAGHSNSAAIGPPDNTGATIATTTTNQLRLGTGRQVVSMPGFYQGTASNLVTAAGQTNRIDGSLMTYPGEISTIALGANRINMGTNVTVHLLGSPGGTFSIDGIIFGSGVPATGQWLELRNATGFDATFVHESGLEATATYRISTATSTNVIFTNGATAQLRYYLNRWFVWNVWDGRQPTATATNAVGWLDGSATNLTTYGSGKPPLRVWPQTGSVSNSFEVLTTNGAVSAYVGTNGTLVASNMAVTPFSTRVDVPYRLFTVTNTVLVTNATTETAMLSNMLGTATIPANWWTPGKSINISIRGRYFSGATVVVTNWVKLGSTMIATNMAPVVASAAGDMWNTDLTITCRTVGAAGTIYCQGMTTIPNTAGGTTGIGRSIRIAGGLAATIDTTAAQTLAFNIHPGATAQAFYIESAHATVIP